MQEAVLAVLFGTLWVPYRLCEVWERGGVAEFLHLESPQHKYHKYDELKRDAARLYFKVS
jgi:hypothetical protein